MPDWAKQESELNAYKKLYGGTKNYPTFIFNSKSMDAVHRMPAPSEKIARRYLRSSGISAGSLYKVEGNVKRLPKGWDKGNSKSKKPKSGGNKGK